jgi:hypothetical protein
VVGLLDRRVCTMYLVQSEIRVVRGVGVFLVVVLFLFVRVPLCFC